MVLNTPLALLGLLTLPVIVALHALRARNEQRVVSSLTLWRFLDAQVSGARARRIPLTWLLLVDLLIAALLTLALAQPELALTRTVPNARHLILLIDISTSMGATDENPTRFARAQSDAIDLLRTLTPLDTVTLIAFGASAQTIGDSRIANPSTTPSTGFQALIAQLEALTPGETGAALTSALALAHAARDPHLPLEIHLFTDAAYAHEIPPPDTPFILHPYGTSDNNQAVLNLALASFSAQKRQLFARFANFANASVTRRATLLADGNPVTTVDLTLAAHSTLPYTWDIVGNPTRLTVQLESADTLPADDAASLGLNTPPALTVALVADNPAPVDRALAAIPNVAAQIISPTNYLPGSPFDLVIFKNTRPAEKPTSNTLILGLPGETTPFDPTRLIFQPHPFLNSLDFTGLRNLASSPLNDTPTWLTAYPLQTLLAVEDRPLLQHGQTGQTQTTLLNIDITAGNLTQHPAFIILLNNILAYYRSLALPDQIPLGTPLHIPTGTNVSLSPPDQAPISFSSPCPCVSPDTRIPGLYRLTLLDSGGSPQTHWIGVNAGSLTESDITPNQFSVSSTPSTAVPSTLEEPIQLAPSLLALVIILFFLEAYLAWK
ncbi:MAG: VWA domain-containing protein [Anaerolineales bacterium]|nr:VWA domain-containing protein [Anaerolineales bacterium]